ncbi:hypothetical protein ACMV_03130 [Acidiphilium multivorum AIU301]|uniref:Uncharacterized protein n=1 Tax=Acidiphilium multivorum (strain DSM 11245 / JCM 8867 / NBRC 100883 / AIU 301) TaxID=926570 RepID=F0J274_ACIMA|nr:MULTISPECIES: hypothetical protein [Acidiphilium]BAJ79660.1 hypothetical protein ACMV_03130 [Acidiphilium multivorum AIU301]
MRYARDLTDAEWAFIEPLERLSTGLNREGFPLALISDSESVLVKEAGMDGPTTIDGSSSAAFGGD